MQNKKGLSDVVTTVIIIALSLVAVGIVWVVVSSLITENTTNIASSADCLETNFEIVSASTSGTTLSVVIKRIGGNSDIGGFRVYAYNSTSTATQLKSGTLMIGEQKSADLTISKPTKVSVVPYFLVDGNENYCSNTVDKTI